MTAMVSARQTRGCAVSNAPGGTRQGAEEEWQLVDASHELRTPLTALRTEVELALLGSRDADELRAALTSAAEEIRRVCRLADDILVLAQADHGRLPVRLRPLEPLQLLKEAAIRARAAACTQGRQIIIRDGTVGSWLLGDPDRAAQALDNLVSNALQYGSGTISLSAQADGTLIGLHVADQGTGFAEAIAARAFQRFTRGKHRGGGGCGLGLSLVAAIAKAHHGVATVCNLPEGGADACIALPQCGPAAPAALKPTWPGGVERVADEPEGARAGTVNFASQTAARRRAAARHAEPWSQPGAIRSRPSGDPHKVGSTSRPQMSTWSRKRRCAHRRDDRGGRSLGPKE
jgi:Histidine kinase-, DNA gyrase B-, and HSP90-like ATPase/His Kinase A (phospho-acceptor) domain